MYVELELDIPGAVNGLREIAFKQVPFATALALNEVAKAGQKAEVAGIFERFNVRRPGRIKSAVRLSDRASKGSLEATLTIRDPFLVQHEEGGRRVRGDVYRSMPQAVAAKERRVGVLYGRATPSAVLASNRKAFIARMPSGKLGVFRRIGRARLPIELVFAFEREVMLTPRLKFRTTVENVVAREWEKAFGHALARAIATAR